MSYKLYILLRVFFALLVLFTVIGCFLLVPVLMLPEVFKYLAEPTLVLLVFPSTVLFIAGVYYDGGKVLKGLSDNAKFFLLLTFSSINFMFAAYIDPDSAPGYRFFQAICYTLMIITYISILYSATVSGLQKLWRYYRRIW